MKNRSKIKSFVFASMAMAIGFFIAAALIEIGVRSYVRSALPELATQIIQHQDALSRKRQGGELFLPHPYLSFQASYVKLTDAGCMIGDREFAFEKPEGVLRIACLGGSTTMQAYPPDMNHILQPYYNNRVEVMDWGCSGFTIIESTINYLLRVRAFHPDIVIIHHGMNDIAPRRLNSFKIDYTHYRKPMQQPPKRILDNWLHWSWAYAWVQVRAGGFQTDLLNLTMITPKPGEFFAESPPPAYTNAVFKNQLDALMKLAQADGAKVILAGMIYHETPSFTPEFFPVVEEHNQLMKQAAEDFDAVYIDLAGRLNHQTELFMDNCHLTGKGDLLKAKYIAETVNRIMGLPESTWEIQVFEEPEK